MAWVGRILSHVASCQSVVRFGTVLEWTHMDEKYPKCIPVKVTHNKRIFFKKIRQVRVYFDGLQQFNIVMAVLKRFYVVSCACLLMRRSILRGQVSSQFSLFWLI